MNLKRLAAISAAVIMLAIFSAVPESEACTSAIISGRLTPDGRPILWKHRDTKEENNRVDYHGRSKDNKYAFVAIVNGTEKIGQAWMGVNEAGFCIINTASSPMRKFKEDENEYFDSSQVRDWVEYAPTDNAKAAYEALPDDWKKLHYSCFQRRY